MASQDKNYESPVNGNDVEAEAQTVFKVAIDQEYAPYEFVDIDGAIKGFTFIWNH